jgi:hypothetical protein
MPVKNAVGRTDTKLENCIRPLFGGVLNVHFPGTLREAQTHLNRVLAYSGVAEPALGGAVSVGEHSGISQAEASQIRNAAGRRGAVGVFGASGGVESSDQKKGRNARRVAFRL